MEFIDKNFLNEIVVIWDEICRDVWIFSILPLSHSKMDLSLGIFI